MKQNQSAILDKFDMEMDIYKLDFQDYSDWGNEEWALLRSAVKCGLGRTVDSEIVAAENKHLDPSDFYAVALTQCPELLQFAELRLCSLK